MSSIPGEEIEASAPAWIQSIISISIVAFINYLAKNMSYNYSCILYSFLILLIIYTINNVSSTRIRKKSFNVILSLFNFGLYIFTFAMIQRYTKMSVTNANILSFIQWVILSIVIYYELHK